jgi:hypothetical protein
VSIYLKGVIAPPALTTKQIMEAVSDLNHNAHDFREHNIFRIHPSLISNTYETMKDLSPATGLDVYKRNLNGSTFLILVN